MKLNNVIKPNSIGWLDYKLSEKEMDYIWRCIGNKNQNTQCIGDSYDLMDRGDWFFTNCLRPVIDTYSNEFTNLGAGVGIPPIHPYKLTSWWVSYQKKNEFFSYHHHSGIYSFVIWMQIPTSYAEQKKLPICAESNATGTISNFGFHYTNSVGRVSQFMYNMEKEAEGYMVMFPSTCLLYTSPSPRD